MNEAIDIACAQELSLMSKVFLTVFAPVGAAATFVGLVRAVEARLPSIASCGKRIKELENLRKLTQLQEAEFVWLRARISYLIAQEHRKKLNPRLEVKSHFYLFEQAEQARARTKTARKAFEFKKISKAREQ